MSKTWIARDDEGELNVDNLLAQENLEGQNIGVRCVINRMKTMAGDLFTRGQDEFARFVREMALEYEKKIAAELEASVRKHQAEHPWRIAK